MKMTVRIDSKGRVTIPSVIRDELGLGPNSIVEVESDPVKGIILIRPVSSEGVIVDLVVEAPNTNGVSRMIAAAAETGSELRYLKCSAGDNGVRCELIITLLDYSMVKELVDKLSEGGIKVIEYRPVRRGRG